MIEFLRQWWLVIFVVVYIAGFIGFFLYYLNK